jgi:hypothetical protein
VLQQLLFSMATALQVAAIRSFLISLTGGVQNVLFHGHLLSGSSSTPNLLVRGPGPISSIGSVSCLIKLAGLCHSFSTSLLTFISLNFVL